MFIIRDTVVKRYNTNTLTDIRRTEGKHETTVSAVEFICYFLSFSVVSKLNQWEFTDPHSPSAFDVSQWTMWKKAVIAWGVS